MAKTLFLHIGLHKTGTTALQKTFLDNRKSLREHGIDYFCRKPNGELGDIHGYFSYHKLSKCKGAFLLHPDPFKHFLGQCPSDIVVVSSEQFSWISDKEVLLSLKELLKDFNLKVILYLRRQDRQFISHYQEGSKYEGGLLKPVKSYWQLGSTMALPGINPEDIQRSYLDYHYKFKLWASVFGKEALIPRIYEESKLVDGNIVADFLSLVKCDWRPSTVCSENISVCASMSKFGHLMSEVTGSIDPDLEKALRRSVWLACNGGKKALPSRDQAKESFSMFRDISRQLSQDLGDGFDEDLFDLDFSFYPVLAQDQWDEDSANQVIRSILICLKDRFPG